MIDLKDRPDLGWNTLLTLSGIAIAAALWFQFGVAIKPPSPPNLDNQSGALMRSKGTAASDAKTIAEKTWQMSQDAMAPAVLEYLTSECEKNSVQLTSFRTDKSIRVATLDEEPFVAVVEGGFPDVLALAHSLESPGSKLAVNLIELSASETAPGHVTATLGLLGFLFKEPQ